jgi:hypothetical protein
MSHRNNTVMFHRTTQEANKKHIMAAGIDESATRTGEGFTPATLATLSYCSSNSLCSLLIAALLLSFPSSLGVVLSRVRFRPDDRSGLQISRDIRRVERNIQPLPPPIIRCRESDCSDFGAKLCSYLLFLFHAFIGSLGSYSTSIWTTEYIRVNRE